MTLHEESFRKADEESPCIVFSCRHNCIIAEGKRGICGVRENRDGILYSLVYGLPCANHVDPIEKKPLFHFYPGIKGLFHCDGRMQFPVPSLSEPRYFARPARDKKDHSARRCRLKTSLRGESRRSARAYPTRIPNRRCFTNMPLTSLQLAQEEGDSQ